MSLGGLNGEMTAGLMEEFSGKLSITQWNSERNHKPVFGFESPLQKGQS